MTSILWNLPAFVLLTSIATVGAAGEPLRYFEVTAVTPSRAINHDVDLKAAFDVQKIETLLDGPRLFAQSIGCAGQAVEEPTAYFNWYKIARPVTEPRRVIQVREELLGKSIGHVAIGDAAYLLSPAQKVTTGPPSQIPDGVNYFTAYKIHDPATVDRRVKITQSFGPEERMVTKAIFLCMPVEEWHHHDHFTVNNSQTGMLVYQLKPYERSLKISTIDQFGLNTLTVNSSDWLCAPTQIVKQVRP